MGEEGMAEEGFFKKHRSQHIFDHQCICLLLRGAAAAVGSTVRVGGAGGEEVPPQCIRKRVC